MELPEIIVKPSCIQITNYKFGSCPRIENSFSVYDKVTFSYYYIGIYYDKENKILYLPRGIDIWFLENTLGVKAKIEKNTFNEFDIYNDIKIKYLPRDKTQKEALKFMLGKNEYRDTATKSQLSVNLNTGKGKTYISVATFAYTGIKSMIITYAVNWLEQWKDKILEYTNLQEKEICFIANSNMIFRLMRITEKQIRSYKIFLVTHATIKSYGDKNGWDEVSNLFKKLKIGIKIFDEAHMNFQNMAMIDFFSNVYKTYYLTATAMRSDPRENQIYQTSMKNVLSIELFDQKNDPHSDYLSILYNSKPEAQIVSFCKNKYGMDRNKYTNYIINNERFKKVSVVLIDLVLNILNGCTPKEKCLIYIGVNNAIETFCHWIVEYFPELEGEIGIYTSIVSPEEKELAKKKRFIITTTKSASACLDIDNLKVVLLLCEPFASELLARQTIGRLRNPNTLYIELVDTGFYHCKSYYQKKKPVFAKYAKTCQQTNLTDTELENRYKNIVNKLMERKQMIHFYENLSKPIQFYG